MSVDSAPAVRRAAVVVNPTKVDVERLRSLVDRAAEAAGFASTHWFETSVDDAGETAAREALALSPDVVLTAGGDGTVRTVAGVLRSTGVPLALVPTGTGNLLARNLEVSLSLGAAVRAAFTGADTRIDVGVAEITRAEGDTVEDVFLVVAGLGLDAEMITHTNSKLKKAVGWLAYLDGGMRALSESMPAHMYFQLDGGPTRHLLAHTLMMGNCGVLPGGMLLIPDARVDDGILDFVAFKPRGRFGWVRVWNKIWWENGVLRKSALGRRIIDLSRDVRDVASFRGRELVVEVSEAQECQLDGDGFGLVTKMHTRVDAGALTVRLAKR
ncbi:MAG TPA: diacylglycerol kinase family protein [Terrimesophilobacter sp.]|nr:diacylglycerol kinase family protein [Terrimesophilobacter sp.]HRP99582.1 diacylglycerol kinase family protein [Terrimesophilobacter sp.]